VYRLQQNGQENWLYDWHGQQGLCSDSDVHTERQGISTARKTSSPAEQMIPEHKPFRVRRVRDGLFYRGPMHKNVFTKTGKRFKTHKNAQQLIDDYGVYQAFDNGTLEIVED